MTVEEFKAAIAKDLINLLPTEYEHCEVTYHEVTTPDGRTGEVLDLNIPENQLLMLPVLFVKDLYQQYKAYGENYAYTLQLIANTLTKVLREHETFTNSVHGSAQTREEYLQQIALNMTMYVIPDHRKEEFESNFNVLADNFATKKIGEDITVYFFLTETDALNKASENKHRFVTPILKDKIKELGVSEDDLYLMAQVSIMDREEPQVIDLNKLILSSDELFHSLIDSEMIVPPDTFYAVSYNGKPFGTRYLACTSFMADLIKSFNDDIVILPTSKDILLFTPSQTLLKDIPNLRESLFESTSVILCGEDPWFSHGYVCSLNQDGTVNIKSVH